MAAVISTMSIKMDLDPSGFNSAMDNVRKKLDDTGAKLRGLGTQLTGAVTAPIAGAFAMAVMAASDLNETLNKTTVVFGDAAAGVLAWSEDSATAFGLSQNEALGMAATFGNIFTGMGIAGDAAAAMSQDIVALGADLGSFNNVPTAEALEAIRAGLLGEYEPLRRFGIVLDAAAVEARALEMGLVDANGEVTEAGKVAARQALITEGAANAQGDFAETSGSLANQMKILRARLTNAAAAIGQILLPYVTRMVSFVGTLVERFGDLSNRMRVIIVVVGVFAASIGPVLLALGFMLPIISKLVGVGAKLIQLFKALRIAMMGSLGPILLIVAAIAAIYFIWTRDLFGIRTKITAWFDVFKSPGGGLDNLKAKFEQLKVTLQKLGAQGLVRVKKAFEDLQKAIGRVWDRVKGPLTEFAKLVGATLVKAVNWALDNLYRLQPLIDRIGAVLSSIVALVGALFRGDWQAAWDAFKSIVENASGAALEAFRLAWEAIKGIASRIDWGALVSGAAGLGGKLLSYIDDLGLLLWGWAQAGATYLAGKIVELWDEHGETIKATAAKFVGYIDDVGLLLWGWAQDGATYLAGEIGKLWDEHGETIKATAAKFVGYIDDVGLLLWDWLKAGATYLAGLITTLWDEHGETIKATAAKFVGYIDDVGLKLWDWLKAGVGYVAGLIATIWDEHGETIKQVPGRLVTAMGSIGSQLWTWIKSGASYLANKLSTLWDDYKDDIAKIPGLLVDLMTGLGAKLWSWAKTGAKWFAGKVAGLWDDHKSTIAQLPGRLVAGIGALGSTLWSWAKTGASYLATQVMTIWDEHKGTFSQLPGKLIGAIGGLGGQLYEWVKAGASSAVTSVGTAGGDVLNSMSTIGTRMGTALKNAVNGALSGVGDWLIVHINNIISGINSWIDKLPGNVIPKIPLIGGGQPSNGGGGARDESGGGIRASSIDTGFGGAQTINATITINVTGVTNPKDVANMTYQVLSNELGLRGAV